MGFGNMFLGMYLIMASLVMESDAFSILPNKKLTATNNGWFAIAKNETEELEPNLNGLAIQFRNDRAPEKTFPSRPRRSTSNQDDAISWIAFLIQKGETEYAFLLLTKFIEGTTVVPGAEWGKVIEQIVTESYHQDHASKILDFILLELQEVDHICLGLKALFKVMEKHEDLAKDEGSNLVRAAKKFALLFREQNEDGDQNEKCSLKQLADRMPNDLIKHKKIVIPEEPEFLYTARGKVLLRPLENSMRIASYLREKNRAAAFAIYSELIEKMSVTANERKQFIEKIVSDSFLTFSIEELIDFITLELNDPEEKCLWLNTIFLNLENRFTESVPTLAGLRLARSTKRIAHLFRDSNGICSLEEAAKKMSDELIKHSVIIAIANGILQGFEFTIRQIFGEFRKNPMVFDSIMEKLIPMIVSSNIYTKPGELYGRLSSFNRRCIIALDILHALDAHYFENPSTIPIDGFFYVSQTLQNVEPQFLLTSKRITMFDEVDAMLNDATFDEMKHLPIQYQQKLTEVRKEIPLQIQRIVGDSEVFIYKIGNLNNQIRKFMTANKLKRSSSNKGITSFEESDTTNESSQWILEPINNVNHYRIKNKESGEYLYSDDDNTLDGFPNKRTVFTYKLDNETDINSLGNRTIWEVTTQNYQRDQYVIKNLHWNEYMDSHNYPLNKVYTWKDENSPPETASQWMISVAHKNKLRLVCYFDSLATQREGAGRFTADNINPSFCTHLVYHRARIDSNTFTMTIGDEKIDIIDKGYEKIIALKQQNPQLKVMIALGGWDNETPNYTRLQPDAENIKTFVESAVNFLQKSGFDGIHYDLQYYGFPSVNNSVTSLLKALSDGLKVRNYLLSAAVAPSGSILHDRKTIPYYFFKGYDIPLLNQMLDFISVLPFLYHDLDLKRNPDAPLEISKVEGGGIINSVNELIGEGVSPHKIVVGISFSGTSWTFKSNETNSNASASLAPPAGKIIKSKDEIPYYEICKAVQNDGWQVFQDPDELMGPYGFLPNDSNGNIRWVSYDDPVMAVIKANYILLTRLGGAFVSDVSMDDFRNACGGGVNPMLTAVAATFGIKASNSIVV